jgi:hypothetical protein
MAASAAFELFAGPLLVFFGIGLLYVHMLVLQMICILNVRLPVCLVYFLRSATSTGLPIGMTPGFSGGRSLHYGMSNGTCSVYRL